MLTSLNHAVGDGLLFYFVHELAVHGVLSISSNVLVIGERQLLELRVNQSVIHAHFE